MKKSKKIGRLLLGLVLVFGLVFCVTNKGTLAYLTDKDDAVNVITVGKSSIEIVEKDGAQKENVGIHNDGSIGCYVRLMVTIPSIEGLDYTMEREDNWIYNENDGYWYYNEVLDADDTAILYKTIRVTKLDGKFTEEDLYNYGDIVVYGEAVQADNILQGVTPEEGKNMAMYAFDLLNSAK